MIICPSTLDYNRFKLHYVMLFCCCFFPLSTEKKKIDASHLYKMKIKT